MDDRSGIVKLNLVDDFIAPGQSCIKPLAAAETGVKIRARNKTAITGEKASASGQSEKLKISISDCLACSGCVTSNEAILLESNEGDKLLGALEDAKTVIVGVSPHALASLAAAREIGAHEAYLLIRQYLSTKAYTTAYIVDMTLFRAIHYRYLQAEYLNREEPGSLVCSICPGVVSYSEKIKPAKMLPHLSRIRSPMLIGAALTKQTLCARLGLKPADVFFAFVSPCHDKKLEAARDDAKLQSGENLVDAIITTAELHSILPKTVDYPDLSACQDFLDYYKLSENRQIPVAADYGKSIVNNRQFNESKIRNMPSLIRQTDDEKGVDESVLYAYGYKHLRQTVTVLDSKAAKINGYIECMGCPQGCCGGGGQVTYPIAERAKKMEIVQAQYAQLNHISEGIVDAALDEWRLFNPEFEKFVFNKFYDRSAPAADW